jgi:RNA polymerase sigma factor (sigma-70 family)
VKSILKTAHRLATDPRSDRELLAAFTANRDPDALAELIRRHAGSVRQVAADVCPSAADDVAQAAFVLFAERAAKLAGRESAAGWLFEVARQLALRASTAAARRARHEAGAPLPSVPSEPLDELTFREVRAIVAEELARLPERLRVPLVLHYWEGATHAEIASRLECSISTAKRRLDAGRERLGVRLVRRGFTGAGVLAALAALATSQVTARTPLPRSFAEAIATGAAGARGAVSAGGAELLRGTVSATPAKFLAVAACVLILGVGLSLGLVPSNVPDPLPEVPVAAIRAPARDVPPRFDAAGDPLPSGAIARLGTLRLRHA